MALRNILGITIGLGAALGAAAFAAKKLFGGDDASYSGDFPSANVSGSTSTPAAPREGLDPTLLEILACPDDKEPVIYQKEGDAERLTCTVCGKRYPVRDGIPVMLIDEATTGPVPSQAEVDAAKALISQGKPALVGAASATSVTSATSATSASSTSGSTAENQANSSS
jgi:uncharacterized protein